MPAPRQLARVLVLALPALLLSVLLAQSPRAFGYLSAVMSTEGNAASGGVVAKTETNKPWADGPLTMISTPVALTNKTDMWTTGASHMCVLHNAVFRAFNSIWLQAPHVGPHDAADFVGYALAWFRFVRGHHDEEEGKLFPAVERLLGEDVFRASHEEHQAFLPGLLAYGEYLSSLPQPRATSFSGTHLRELMAAFQGPFESHFRAEITTIASLASHPNAPAPGSPADAAAHAAFERWGRDSVLSGGGSRGSVVTGVTEGLMMFMYNHDGADEPGTGWESPRWRDIPPVPGLVRRAVVLVAGARHRGWWRFASCDGSGRRRELPCAGNGEG